MSDISTDCGDGSSDTPVVDGSVDGSAEEMPMIDGAAETDQHGPVVDGSAEETSVGDGAAEADQDVPVIDGGAEEEQNAPVVDGSAEEGQEAEEPIPMTDGEEESHPHGLPDAHFTDGQGRPISIRTWDNGNSGMIRVYDTNQQSIPENADIGQAGYANVQLETSATDGSTRVRLQDILISDHYRGSGISTQILSQAQAYAQQHGASEIYGSIDSPEARSFWEHQADRGWVIDSNTGAYGEVHYTLAEQMPPSSAEQDDTSTYFGKTESGVLSDANDAPIDGEAPADLVDGEALPEVDGAAAEDEAGSENVVHQETDSIASFEQDPEQHVNAAVASLQQVEGIQSDAWQNLEPSERLEALQEVENRMAELQGRKPLIIRTEPMESGAFGYYDGQSIAVNENDLAGNDMPVQEFVDTIVHEGRHAYQDHAINNPGAVDESIAATWAENMKPGNYLTAEDYGQEAYANQPIEADAWNYGSRIAGSLYDNEEGGA